MPQNYYDDDTVERENNFGKSLKLIGKIILVLIVFRWTFMAGLFYEESFNGPGYTMDAPLEWNRVDKERLQALEDENTTIVAYVTKEEDAYTELPVAQIAVYSVSLPHHMWIEDEYPEIVGSIKRSGVKLIDEGQVKINEEDFYWVFTDDREEDILSLQFFTISEKMMFYKIVFSAGSKYFNKYRPEFERIKDTFVIKFGLY